MTTPTAFRRFKAATFALLAANLALYALLGRPSELVDAAAWLVLLVLFEVETAHGGRLSARQRQLIHVLRLAAAAGVLAAAAGYLVEGEWLDAANAGLWLAVVALLEIEVRFPAASERQRKSFLIAAVVLYAALLLLVPVWAWRGEWLDAWDAALWLAAFFAIELNVLAPRTGYSAQS
jgi:hypothetical protein